MGDLLCAGALGLVVAACLEDPRYACTGDASCRLNNVQGVCDLATSTCLYQAPNCPSGWRDGHGACAIPSMPLTTSTSSVESSTGDESEASSSASEESSSGNATLVTTGPVECGVGEGDITDLGDVGASTVYPGYPETLAVDGSLMTSWFSTGPEAMGPTTFIWTASNERCITRIEFDGNSLNENEDWREGWGFDSFTIKVTDPFFDTVFEQTRQLPGTPDPHVTVETGGVVGTRVVLEFEGHENPEGGGFAELQVLGQ